VTLRLVQPVPYLPYVLRHTAWFPVHLPTIEKFGPADRKGSAWTRAGNLVGNGPFVLTKWQPNQAITTERSPTYWNAANVKLDAVVFHAIEDVNTEERMFRAGQLDTTNTMPPDKIEVYRRDHPEMLRLDPYYGTYYFNLNVTRPPLDDVRVRRALALAIDRKAIVKTITRGGQEPAYHFTPPYAGYTPGDVLSGGLAEARRLLAETDLAVTRIAAECGFHNLSNFNSQFRAIAGVTPIQLRRSQPEAGAPPDGICSSGTSRSAIACGGSVRRQRDGS
jgi:oligopeptide transport system substrate-binding protein